MVHWYKNEVPWAIDHWSTSFPGAAAQLFIQEWIEKPWECKESKNTPNISLDGSYLLFEEYLEEKTCVCVLKLCQKRPTYTSLLKIFEWITPNYNFLPTARADFYFKVILSSVSYGLVVWGSCDKSLFDDLEKIHVLAKKRSSMAWIGKHPATRGRLLEAWLALTVG